ncbi:hypothetical protein H8959_006417 [Pygathrix nigripes]
MEPEMTSGMQLLVAHLLYVGCVACRQACGSPASPSGVARTLLGPGSLLTILNSDFPEPLALLRFQGLIPVPQGGFKLLGLEELGGLGPWSPVEGAGDIQMLEAGGREHRLCVLHTELQVCPSHCEPCDLSRRLKLFLHPMRPITPSASEHSRDQDEHGGSCPGTWHTVTGWQDAHLQVWPEGKSVDILVWSRKWNYANQLPLSRKGWLP